MADHFQSPKRRLARANEHLNDIKSRVDAFLKTKPYARVVEKNAKGFEEHKIKMTANIPDVITDLTYEAIEALRASLDQAVYPIAVACGARRPDLIHFPIADTPAYFENILNGMKDFPADILTLFRGFKPYKGGNILIWALNRIRRQGYHRLIVPVGTASAGAHIVNLTASAPVPCEVLVPRWDRKKNEMIFVRTGPGSDLEYNIQFAFFVAFGEVEGLAGEPVIETLEAVANEVGRIISTTEKEARRIELLV